MVHSLKNLDLKHLFIFLILILTPISLANALGDEDNSDPSLDDIVEIMNDGISGADYNNTDYSGIPLGQDYSFTFNSNEDGIDLEAHQSYRSEVDFSDYVNTSGGTVTVLDATAGFSAGADLGCNGLNIFQEAMFEFNADNLVENFGQYLTTTLATEALTQIYALPLVSTVMDGIKSMKNFVAEFSQASCDMTQIKSRAKDIKDQRYEECLATIPKDADGVYTESIQEKCGEGEITKNIKKFKCYIKNKESFGGSLSELIGTPLGGDPSYSSIGSTIASFLPDVTYSANGGSAKTKAPAISLTEVGDRSWDTSINTLYNLYNKIMKSMDDKNIDDPDIRDIILMKIQKYKTAMLFYGSQNIINDGDSDLEKTYSDASRNNIYENWYKPSSAHAYKTIETTSKGDLFKIGPTNGPTTNSVPGDDETDLNDDIRDMFFLSAGHCFAKVNVDSDDSGKYKWIKVHSDPVAFNNINNLGYERSLDPDGSTADWLVARISRCVALDILDLGLLDRNYRKSPAVGQQYLNFIAKTASFTATTLIKQAVENNLNYIKVNQKAILKKKCEDSGVAAMPSTAATDSCSNTTPYTSCEEYVEQNGLSEEKILKIDVDIQELNNLLTIMKLELDTAEKYLNNFLDLE